VTEQEKAEAIATLIDDFEQYAALNLKIKTKDGAIEPLDFNEPQKYIHQQLEQQLTATGKIRAILLKGRQQGASTYTEGRFYWRTSMNFGKQAYILTHEQAATDNLFTMAKRYHDNCHPELKPSTGAANAKELVFDVLDSGYKVGTAGSRTVGRSGTIQYFHGSELGFWPNAQEHFAGVVQCVADAAGTEIILESTANGIGGKFHDLWMEAVSGNSDYIAIFVPWFWTEEYRKGATGFVPTDEELRHKKIYGVDNEQLAWRRAKINDLGKDLADQEYPYCWQDAFLSTGRTVFEKTLTATAIKECWTPKSRRVLENKRWIERKDGELRVWAEPEQGKRYCIGADVAEGLLNGDYSSAMVREVTTGEQVAEWHGHIAPDLFGKILLQLGKWYNNAYLGVENNNHGLATLIYLRDTGYPMLYVQRRIDDAYSGDVQREKLGFSTNTKTKPYIIDQLSAELREGTHGICSKELAQEMQTYVIDEQGRYGAATGCYDDRVMAYAICGEMIRMSPLYRKKKA
jgi:hypothetical protein